MIRFLLVFPPARCVQIVFKKGSILPSLVFYTQLRAMYQPNFIDLKINISIIGTYLPSNLPFQIFLSFRLRKFFNGIPQHGTRHFFVVLF